MNHKLLLTILTVVTFALACGGPSVADQAATELARDAHAMETETSPQAMETAKAVVSATLTVEASAPCIPPESVRDPLVPESALMLTRWEVFDPAKQLEYQTTRGLVSFHNNGDAVLVEYPGGQVNRELVGDRRLIAIAPTFVRSDGKTVSQFGPIFFYRCGESIFVNTEMSAREAVTTPP